MAGDTAVGTATGITAGHTMAGLRTTEMQRGTAAITARRGLPTDHTAARITAAGITLPPALTLAANQHPLPMAARGLARLITHIQGRTALLVRLPTPMEALEARPSRRTVRRLTLSTAPVPEEALEQPKPPVATSMRPQMAMLTETPGAAGRKTPTEPGTTFRSLPPLLMVPAAGAAAVTLIAVPSVAMVVIRLRAVAGMIARRVPAGGLVVAEAAAGVAAVSGGSFAVASMGSATGNVTN